MAREPRPEESLALGVVQRNQGPFVLVPVLVHGVERYALAACRNVGGEQKVQILAVCVNMEDQGTIVSLDGTVARPLRKVGAQL